MNAIDLVVWEAAILLVMVALRTGGSRAWPALGVVLGLGLMNKISVLWLGVGLAGALLLTPYARGAADARAVARAGDRARAVRAPRRLAGAATIGRRSSSCATPPARRWSTSGRSTSFGSKSYK